MPRSLLCSLLLLAAPSGVLSQVQLVQTGPGAVKPGETLPLSCAVSGYTITSGYSWHWVRQPPGRALEWLGRGYYSGSTWNTNYAPSLQTRITIAADSAKNQFSLRLGALTAADTATYYCARGYPGYYFDIWGQGTMVTVTTAEPAAPSLFPLVPSCGQDTSQDPLAVGCLAKNFLPDSLNFTWKDETKDIDGFKRFPSVLDTTGTYTAASQLSVSASNSQEKFYCSAHHPKGNKIITVTFPRQCNHDTRMIIRPPARDQFKEPYNNSTIICSIEGLCSKDVTVKWLKDGQAVSSGISNSTVSSGSNGYTFRSELSVMEKDWDQGHVFSCKVESKNFSDMRNTSKPLECGGNPIPPGISSLLIPPTFADIYIHKSAILTCRVTDMQSTDGLNVIWKRENGKELATKLGQRKVQSNGLYSVDATTSVCGDEWEKGDSYTCHVAHPDLIFPFEKTFTKQPVINSHAPSVYLSPPAPEQLALHETATLTCLVKGFNPPDFFVRWLNNGVELNDSSYFTTEPILESKQPVLYFAYSTLNVDGERWNSGDSYTCLVGHEKLPLQVTQRTVDKSTGKPTLVNVSLVMSDTATTCY